MLGLVGVVGGLRVCGYVVYFGFFVVGELGFECFRRKLVVFGDLDWKLYRRVSSCFVVDVVISCCEFVCGEFEIRVK